MKRDLSDRVEIAIINSNAAKRVAAPLDALLNRLFQTAALRPLKLLLNGTWFGHQLHPLLTDVPNRRLDSDHRTRPDCIDLGRAGARTRGCHCSGAWSFGRVGGDRRGIDGLDGCRSAGEVCRRNSRDSEHVSDNSVRNLFADSLAESLA